MANLCRSIDDYGVTFGHLIPADGINREVLQIRAIENEDISGGYRNTWLSFVVNPAEFIRKEC